MPLNTFGLWTEAVFKYSWSLTTGDILSTGKYKWSLNIDFYWIHVVNFNPDWLRNMVSVALTRLKTVIVNTSGPITLELPWRILVIIKFISDLVPINTSCKFGPDWLRNVVTKKKQEKFLMALWTGFQYISGTGYLLWPKQRHFSKKKNHIFWKKKKKYQSLSQTVSMCFQPSFGSIWQHFGADMV